MSDGGAIVNYVDAIYVRPDTFRLDASNLKIMVTVSGDSVEIGDLSFNRQDLLFALGSESI